MNERDYELLDAWRHGEISEVDFAELQKRLESEAELRAALQGMADLEEGLNQLAMEPLPLGLQERTLPSDRSLFAYGGWVVAAVLLICLSIGLYVAVHTQPVQITTDTLETNNADSADAVVTNQIDAEFAEGENRIETGQALDGKWVRILAGIVQIEFASGALLALQGPAELRVDSDMDCYLKHGKLTILAPPEATLFTVKSPTGNVIDLGTEFGMVVDADGQMDVHVLDGEVEVEAGDEERRRLVENEAATIDPHKKQIQDTAIDRQAFDAIRHQTLVANRALKLQLDCGIRAGVYHGTESPAHVAGDMAASDIFWNGLIGDQSGRFVLADGSVSPMSIEIDYGQTEFVHEPGQKPRRAFSWDAVPQLVRSSYCVTRGVFDTALGQDRLSSGGVVGLRIKGLPTGKYRIYFIARAVDDCKRGNYLILKTFRVAMGTNLSDIPKDAPVIAPLDNPEAEEWVAGQTHHVDEVELKDPNDFVTLFVKRDPALSPQRAGGGSPIVGVQVIQID